MKIKHSKYRNTGLIFELLVKQIAADTLNNKESNLIEKIGKLDFKNSLLSDNLDLDYVEILIRERFLFGKKDEKIYVLEDSEE